MEPTAATREAAALRRDGETTVGGRCGPARLDYESPRLLVLGDVRDVTLGATSGLDESGGGGTSFFNNPG